MTGLNSQRFMKALGILTTIAAVLLVGCVTMLPQDLAIFNAVQKGDIKAVNQHLAGGVDVNAA